MFVVIFKAKIRAVDPEYSQLAAQLRSLALTDFGCLEFHSVSDGDTEIALSYWPSTEAIAAWRAHPEHLRAQQSGQSRWYEYYSVQVATITRQYSGPHSSAGPIAE
ncbi:MAG: antibiotic biosynthesis monooxygenase [Acidobacteria bacterium]|nr:antibiotic biosynthesis monooxygenase [Acidobacteriota bacterium]